MTDREAKLSPYSKEAVLKREAEARANSNRVRCGASNIFGKPCVLDNGHYGDHSFDPRPHAIPNSAAVVRKVTLHFTDDAEATVRFDFEDGTAHERIVTEGGTIYERPPATRNREARDIIARLYGQAAFGWGLDEPNRSTGYQLRSQAADFADAVIERLREAGFSV